MLAPTMARADYNVAVGNSFTYEVVKSNWDITYGADSSTGKGFNYDEIKYTEKTQLTVEVTAASASSVSWDMDIGTDTYSGTNIALDGLFFLFVLFYPLLYSSMGTWNQTYMDLGPELIPIFFVDPQLMSDFFFELSNETYISTAFSTTDWIISNIGGSFDNTSTVAVFEWHFDTTLTNGPSGHNYGGTFTFIYAFSKTTGQMKGIYMDMDYSGQVDFTVTNIKMTHRVEEVGYNLPGVGLFPGFEWFMVIPAFAFLVGLPIIIKKRK